MQVLRIRNFAIGVATACLLLSCVPRLSFADDFDAALKRRVNADFREVPIAKAITRLAKSSRVPVVIDRPTIARAAIQLDELLVTHLFRDVTLEVAIEEMVHAHGLEWFRHHDVLWITTGEATNGFFDTRVYKITRPVRADRRMRSIMWNVAPQSWATVGGQGDVAPVPPKLLVIRQSALRHRQIARKFSQSIVQVRSDCQFSNKSVGSQRHEQPIALNFTDVRLAEALRQLGDQESRKITIDRQSIEDAGIQIDELVVSLQVGEVRGMDTAMSLLLDYAHPELEWYAERGAINITTVDHARKAMRREVYKVPGIVPSDDTKLVREAIEYTIAPSSWEHVGGEATLAAGDVAGTLDVHQSFPAHRALRRLFADLRAADKQSD